MKGKIKESGRLELISPRAQEGNLGESSVTSDHPSQLSWDDSVIQRRKPRLSLTSEHFRLGANGKIFSIIDLSSHGMAIRVVSHEDLVYFPIAMQIEGILNLKGVRNSVIAQVRNVSKDRVGCQFHELSSQARQEILAFLNPAVLGRELKPIPTGEIGSLWYHGPSGTDLLFWRGLDGVFQRFALYFHGFSVEWSQKSRLTTGTVQRMDPLGETHGVILFDHLVIRRDLTPDGSKLDIAKALVMSSNLPEDMKNWCVRQLEQRS